MEPFIKTTVPGRDGLECLCCEVCHQYEEKKWSQRLNVNWHDHCNCTCLATLNCCSATSCSNLSPRLCVCRMLIPMIGSALTADIAKTTKHGVRGDAWCHLAITPSPCPGGRGPLDCNLHLLEKMLLARVPPKKTKQNNQMQHAGHFFCQGGEDAVNEGGVK